MQWLNCHLGHSNPMLDYIPVGPSHPVSCLGGSTEELKTLDPCPHVGGLVEFQVPVFGLTLAVVGIWACEPVVRKCMFVFLPF